MKMTIVGCRSYNFEDEKTGREVAGLSLSYYATPADEPEVQGSVVGKLSIKKGTELYRQVVNMDFGIPFDADAVFEVQPGRKQAVLADLRF